MISGGRQLLEDLCDWYPDQAGTVCVVVFQEMLKASQA